MIPAPEKSVIEIGKDTLSDRVVRSVNRYWTELTLAMIVGHYLGNQHGYLMLIGMGSAAIGMDILLNVIRENLSQDKRTQERKTGDDNE